MIVTFQVYWIIEALMMIVNILKVYCETCSSQVTIFYLNLNIFSCLLTLLNIWRIKCSEYSDANSLTNPYHRVRLALQNVPDARLVANFLPLEDFLLENLCTHTKHGLKFLMCGHSLNYVYRYLVHHKNTEM